MEVQVEVERRLVKGTHDLSFRFVSIHGRKDGVSESKDVIRGPGTILYLPLLGGGPCRQYRYFKNGIGPYAS